MVRSKRSAASEPRYGRSSPFAPLLRSRNKGDADTLVLQPNDLTFPHDGTLGHHQAEARRHESGVVDVDGRAFRRDVPNYTAHDRTAYRHVGRLIDFRTLIFPLLFH